MSIYAGLPDPSAPARAFMDGLRRGQAEREEREVRGALSAYVINPDDEGAFQTLAQYRPEIAMQVRSDREKRQQEAAVADLQRRAAGGDRTALAELAGIDIDAYDKLADNERVGTKERVSAIGQAALAVSQLPPEQRPAAWDGYIDQLSQRYPELAEYRGQYSEQALMGAIAQAEQMGKFFELSDPRFQVIPEGGTLVNTRDPAAIQQYMEGLGNIPPPPAGFTLDNPGGGVGNGTGGFP